MQAGSLDGRKVPRILEVIQEAPELIVWKMYVFTDTLLVRSQCVCVIFVDVGFHFK